MNLERLLLEAIGEAGAAGAPVMQLRLSDLIHTLIDYVLASPAAMYSSVASVLLARWLCRPTTFMPRSGE
jgi:hypothetical protein